jgi:hypothetical protein
MRVKQRTPFVLACSSLALIVAVFVWRLQLLQTRTFDPDEFEHLHAAWSVHQGLLPYRDFFEHHMPGLHYTLSWLIGAFNPTTREDMIHVVFVARTIMWILSGCTVILTMVLAWQLDGAAVGWISGALLSSSLVFIGRTLEIRPDVPSLALELGFLVALVGAMRLSGSPRRRGLILVSGLCLGVSLLFNQKFLLAGPGIAVFVLWYLAAHESPVKSRLKDILTLSAAALAPLLAIALFFGVHGALGDFIRGTLLNNLTWGRELSAGSTIHWLLLRDPLFTGAAVAGLVWAILEIGRRPTDLSLAAITLVALSLLAGLFVTPTPFPQYLLPMLALGAVLAARVIWAASSGWPDGSGGAQQRVARWAAVLSGTAVASIGLLIARPFFVAVFVYPIFGLVVIVSAGILSMRRVSEWAVVLLIVGCSAYSLQQLRWMQGLSNAEAVAEMRYVYDSTAPADDVLDGFTGVAWFRPNAFVYWFLHPGMRAHLTAADVDSLMSTVTSCGTRPKLIILDDDLSKVSPRLAPTVTRLYDPSPYPFIWRRKDPCVQ